MNKFYITVSYLSVQLIWSTSGQGDSVEPCFSAFVSSTIPPTSSIACNQLYDCLQSCLSNPVCKSILWDDSKYYCYHFSQTARINPTILLNKFGTAYYERSAACGCPNGASIAYFLATSYELSTSSAFTVLNTKEDDCLVSCTQQKSTVDGAALSCQSMNINVKTKQCQISAANGPPDGSGTVRSNPDSVFVQKFCLPNAASSNCAEQFFFLFPQQTFDGSTLSTAKATSAADCAGQCTVTTNCQAGVFDTASKDCVLKSSSAKVAPANLKVGSSTSYYFENGCLLRQQAPATSRLTLTQRLALLKAAEVTESGSLKLITKAPWTNWSPCQHKISGKRFRTRTRSCAEIKTCDENDIQYKISNFSRSNGAETKSN
uniref:Apple domain-containing protein n=1 Tax=Romanomermis culicivorax TaxID=13658 RepID=A0A915L5P6_ROMCU